MRSIDTHKPGCPCNACKGTKKISRAFWLEPATASALRQEAEATGRSQASIVEEALRARLGK